MGRFLQNARIPAFVVLPLLLISAAPAPAAVSNPAKDLYAAYRPMERFEKTGQLDVFVLRGTAWKKAGFLEFDRFFRERRIDLSRLIPAGEPATIRIVRKGGHAAHLDAATLGGVPPSEVRAGDRLARVKAAKADFDVIDVSAKTVEIRFPAGGESRVLSLVARVEGERRVGIPFTFPPANHGKPADRVSSFYNYRPGSRNSSPVRDGRVDGRAKPFFREWSPSASGHPSSWTYGWVGSDDRNLYVRIDFTGDDTRDGDADYTSVLVKGAAGVREFKVSEAETRWGSPSFTYTPKVPWQHKVYDIAIPWKETGAAPGKPVQLAFSAYGTLAGPMPGVYETAAAYDSVNNRYLVVYTRFSVTTNNFNIFGQFVDATGTFIGSEFVIEANNWLNRHPAIAFDPVNGRYLVVYEDAADGYGISAWLLDIDGVIVASSNVAYSPSSARKQFPSVAYNGLNGTYLVAWQDDRNALGVSFDIWGQIVDAGATMIGPDFRISTAANDQANPSVAANALDGTFLVSFDDVRAGVGLFDIYGQLVQDDGSLVGTPDNVNFPISTATFSQQNPRASFDPATRRFLVAWTDHRGTGGTQPDIYGQFLDNTGVLVGGETAISTDGGFQETPVLVHSGPAGAYLAAWKDNRAPGTNTIYGQILLNDGSLFGSGAATNVALVPASDNAVTNTPDPPGIAVNTAVPQALLSFAADPTVDTGVGARLGVRIIGAPPLPGGDLMVVSTTPAGGAAGVSRTAAISVSFNMPVDRATVDNTSFIVERTSDGAPVAGAFTFSADNTVVTFTPSAPLDNNVGYTVTLPADSISDRTGTLFLPADYVLTFTTASGANTVTLFFKDTPGIFGCAVAPVKAGWRDGAGALLPLLLPAIVLLVRRRRRRRGGNRPPFPGLFLLLGAAAMLAAVPARAGMLGPPQPSVGAGKFGAAIGYFYTEDKWKPDTSNVRSGAATVLWETDKVKQNSVFLRGAYGISGKCEVAVKAGIADRAAPQGFEDSYSFLAGVGAKGILYRTPTFAVGPVLDFTWFGNHEDDIAFTQAGTAWRGKENIDRSWDLQVGIGVQASLGRALLYAGPSLYWNRADVRYRITDGTVNLDVENRYKEKTVFGGFAGVRLPLSGRVAAEVEGQYRSAFSAGAMLSYAF